MTNRSQDDRARHRNPARSWGPRTAAAAVALAAAFVPAPARALDLTQLATAYGIAPADGDYYLYIPDALMVRTSADAEQWIDGESRKPDHDRINAVLQAAAPRVGHKIADHYDEAQRPNENSETYYVETWLTFAPIHAWREGAWQNAVALDQAVTEIQRDLIRLNMEVHGFTVAQLFQTPKAPGAWDVREAYCFANQ